MKSKEEMANEFAEGDEILSHQKRGAYLGFLSGYSAAEARINELETKLKAVKTDVGTYDVFLKTDESRIAELEEKLRVECEALEHCLCKKK